jgi:hypothetical protein
MYMIGRHWIQGSVLIAISMMTSAYVLAQTPKERSSTDPDMKPVTRTATIEAIDRAGRLITLKSPEGNLATVYADRHVRRFDELKVGDTVTATYYESIAILVRQPGDPAPVPTSEAIVPGKGPAPGGTGAVQETVTVTVQAIDRANQAVTVKRPDGGLVSFRVRDPKQLEKVKAGDTVDVTSTRSLLVSVTPAK